MFERIKIHSILRRFVPPYRAQLGWNIFFNLLSTILSLFSFAAIIPVLRILFGLNSLEVTRVPLSEVQGLQETIAALRTNLYCVLNEQIALHGAGYVLLLLGLFLIVMTGLKVLTAWLANYFMVLSAQAYYATCASSYMTRSSRCPWAISPRRGAAISSRV